MQCKPTDPCYTFNGMLNVMSGSITIGTVATDLGTRPIQLTKIKRTKFEAAARANDALKEINAFTTVPFFRPYIYALNALTYGLILIDPLDRLE